jgi:hypothetical protein
VGARLRFKPDADMLRGELRGTAVLVLSEMQLVGPPDGEVRLSWRQQVLAMGAGCKVGWARPDQLTLPLDGSEPR